MTAHSRTSAKNARLQRRIDMSKLQLDSAVKSVDVPEIEKPFANGNRAERRRAKALQRKVAKQ